MHPVVGAGKVMASIFWDSQGLIRVDYLEEDHTIMVHIMKKN